jgi:hypothetical protein
MAESTGASVRRGQTCGEVFDAMRIELASRALDSVRSWT